MVLTAEPLPAASGEAASWQGPPSFNMLRCAPRFTNLALIVAALVLSGEARSGRAQITSLADDIILITKGVQNQQDVRADSRIGGSIGGRNNTLGPSPGGRDSRLQAGETPGAGGGISATSYIGRDILAAAESEGQGTPGSVTSRLIPPEQAPRFNRHRTVRWIYPKPPTRALKTA